MHFLSLLERKHRAPGARLGAGSAYKLWEAKGITESPCHAAFLCIKCYYQWVEYNYQKCSFWIN